MALNEQVFWHVLELMRGRSCSWTIEIQGEPIMPTNTQENAIAVTDLKSQLVLRFSRADIEDTIYFLTSRSYVNIHRQGAIGPDIAYCLSNKAIDVLQNKQLPGEEQRAFEENILARISFMNYRRQPSE